MKEQLSKSKLLISSVVNSDMNECYKLKELIRYNHRSRIKNESVAEHSFFVSLFALKILKEMPLLSDKVRLMACEVAILHDVPEYVTSDLPHDVKENYPDLVEQLKVVEEEFYEVNYKEYASLFNCKDDNKDLLIAHKIVKMADIASVIQFCENESSLGNVSKGIQEIYKDASNRIKNLSEEIVNLYDEYVKGLGE